MSVDESGGEPIVPVGVGETVHYATIGRAGKPRCLAAIVTTIPTPAASEGSDIGAVTLFILDPLVDPFFRADIPYDDNHKPGTWHFRCDA